MNDNDRWKDNIEALMAYILKHGNLPDKHKVEN